MIPIRRLSVALCLVLLTVVAQAQDQAGAARTLRVVGLDGKETTITAEQWASLPHMTVEAVEHSGAKAKFEGVAVAELLKRVGAPLGDEMRGPNLAVFVVAEGRDRYRAVYSLTDFDESFSDRVIIVADRKDGQALSDKEGPLRIVVAAEKRQARWVRQLSAIQLMRLP